MTTAKDTSRILADLKKVEELLYDFCRFCSWPTASEASEDLNQAALAIKDAAKLVTEPEMFLARRADAVNALVRIKQKVAHSGGKGEAAGVYRLELVDALQDMIARFD